MSNYVTLITQNGLAKLADAQVSGKTVKITHFAVGDGGGSGYKPTGQESRLKNEKHRARVDAVEADARNPHWIIVTGTIPANIGGFMIREVGMYSEDGTLIAIGNTPDSYKPNLSEGVSKDFHIKNVIELANASTVTLNIDPNVVVATRAWVSQQDEEILNPAAIAVNELVARMRAAELERERFNNQTLMQGQFGAYSDYPASRNGFFTDSPSIFFVSFGGYGQRNTTDYTVLLEVVSGDVGFIGELTVYDKAQNGFKVRATGVVNNLAVNWTIINKKG